MPTYLIPLLVLTNAVVMCALLLLLIAEQRRARFLRERVAQSKQELSAIAHQLRSPLSNIRKYHEFLRNKEFGKMNFAQQEAVNKVLHSLSASIAGINRLLTESQLQESTIVTEMKPVNVHGAMRAAVDAVAEDAERKRHKITIEGSQKLSTKVDPLLLHGILDELLQNAIGYTAEGGNIELKATSGPGSVKITLKDNGIGIATDDLPKIFEKFYRGEKARNMASGNGMGLSFARQFAAQIDGSLVVSSKEGKGTTCIVQIPKT